MRRLYEANPKLFDSIIPRSEKVAAGLDPDTDGVYPKSDPVYLGVLVGERILGHYCKDFLNLPISGKTLSVAGESELSAAFAEFY
jgi:hypothetical protein